MFLAGGMRNCPDWRQWAIESLADQWHRAGADRPRYGVQPQPGVLPRRAFSQELVRW